MSYELFFGEGTLGDIAKFKKSNPVAYKKIERILGELTEHPRTGVGHPEALKGGGNITWSRHFTKKDVIIYDIFDERVLVAIILLMRDIVKPYREIHVALVVEAVGEDRAEYE